MRSFSSFLQTCSIFKNRSNQAIKSFKSRQTFFKKSFAVVLAGVVLSGGVATICQAATRGDGNDVINEAYALGNSLQPVAPSFCVKTLLAWQPDKDPDALFNRSTIPLASRFEGHNINASAAPGARLNSGAISNFSQDKSPTQGSDSALVYAFDYWQYVTTYTSWLGSEEGIFALPAPDIIDAAHKNGVPVLATLGFPWGDSSRETAQELADFTQQNADGSFPVADKMIEVMQYFGFDGYFYNQETPTNGEIMQKMVEMMRYMKRKCPSMIINWYDSALINGYVSYQDAVNDNNKFILEAASDGVRPADEVFMNYNWNSYKVNTSKATLESLGLSPYQALAGFEIQQKSYFNTERIDYTALLDANNHNRLKIGLALFVPSSTMGLAKDAFDFHNIEDNFWTGEAKDPSLADYNRQTSDANRPWRPIAAMIPDKSVIQTLPFYTDFNTGHGQAWFVDGVKMRDTAWNNRSATAINPTWRYWHDGTDLQAGYDFSQAYNGGTSLKFKGNGKIDSLYRLYSTKLALSGQESASLTYLAKPGVQLSLVLNTDPQYQDAANTYIDLDQATGEWQTATVDLSALAGKTIYYLGLKFSGEATDYSANLGQIVLQQAASPALEAINDFKVTARLLHSANDAEARISWQAVAGASYYEVYQDLGMGKWELISKLPNHNYYVAHVKRLPEATGISSKLKVVAIDAVGKRQSSATTDFYWGMPANTSTAPNPADINLALNAKVIERSAEGDAEPATKALDGTAEGNSKWCAPGHSSGYMTIDLGKPETVRRWRVEHGEYGGEAANTNTVDFALAAFINGEWQTVKHITNNTKAVTDVLLDEAVTAQKWKLIINNAGSSPWTAIRIYEWQLFGVAAFTQTEAPLLKDVTATNNVGPDDQVSFKNLKTGAKVKLYRDVNSETAFLEASCEDQAGNLTITTDLGKDAGRLYYSVTDPYSAESIRNSVYYPAETTTIDDPTALANLIAQIQEEVQKLQSKDGLMSEKTGATEQILEFANLQSLLATGEELIQNAADLNTLQEYADNLNRASADLEKAVIAKQQAALQAQLTKLKDQLKTPEQQEQASKLQTEITALSECANGSCAAQDLVEKVVELADQLTALRASLENVDPNLDPTITPQPKPEPEPEVPRIEPPTSVDDLNYQLRHPDHGEINLANQQFLAELNRGNNITKPGQVAKTGEATSRQAPILWILLIISASLVAKNRLQLKLKLLNK